MNHSESLASLAGALAKAQSELQHAHRNESNPNARQKYADLTSVIDATRPTLAKHGISVVQIPGFDGERVSVETIILHESGEWMSGVSGSPMGIQYAKGGRELPPSPQTVGMAITYLRRYALAAVACIGQDDDDGESARSQERPAGEQSTNGRATAPRSGSPACPECGNPQMWDNRAENDERAKKGEKLRPDWKCKKKECEGVIWREDERSASDEAAELDRIVGTIQSMVNEIKGLDADDGDAAQKVLDEYVKKPGMNAERLHRLQSNIAAKLDSLKKPAGVGADREPGEDDIGPDDALPF